MEFATLVPFWSPYSSGIFTMSIDYFWSLTNRYTINFQLEVINPCFDTKLNAFLLRDMVTAVGEDPDI